LSVLALLVGACDSTGHYYLQKEAHEHAAEWGYEGATGPEHWGELSPEYRLATEGKNQSPVNIDTTLVERATLPDLNFRYGMERPVFLNNGHTLQHDEEGGSELEVGGQLYRLEQLHFHTPSEHTIDGRHAPLEVHLVHMTSDGEVAVVAVLVQEGESSNAIQLLAGAHMSDETGETVTIAREPVDPRELLPSDRSYYSYVGSFTTPPCTEGVRWFVLRQPGEAISPGLLSEIAEILNGNNRPVQPLNSRVVRG
jgi:carbonic anhydrase